ncbi:MAG: hypothetical protein JF593_06495 [Novosphingobium sp.]|nr:hypothetical protein [Novosphingobium sp.]
MGLANLPFGMFGALVLFTMPQLLAARSIPLPMISSVTAAAMIPTCSGFLLAPILDVRFSRRSYALAFGLLTAALAVLALIEIADLGTLTVVLVAGFVCATLNYNALGGWLGDIVADGDEGKLGAGFTIGNVGGFGIGAVLFITLVRALPGPLGAVAVGLAIAMPLVLLAGIPPSRADERGLRESFSMLRRDLILLVRRPLVLRTLLFFALPASSFALTNTLGALGHDFAASERFVAVIGATAVTLAGIVGSLLVPQLVTRLAPRLLYLAIGSIGALFTLSLLGMPRSPLVFVVALVGENVFQSAALATESTIVFRSIGEGNPLAATQFALLQAATALPITYMQMIDGQGYGVGGLAGALVTDAGLSLAGCAILLMLVLRWRRGGRRGRASAGLTLAHSAAEPVAQQ